MVQTHEINNIIGGSKLYNSRIYVKLQGRCGARGQVSQYYTDTCWMTWQSVSFGQKNRWGTIFVFFHST
jgi:hypothetical protein